MFHRPLEDTHVHDQDIATHPPPLRPLNKQSRQRSAILDKEKLLFSFQPSVYSSKTMFFVRVIYTEAER
jgi:hypothetical protein